MSENHSIHPFCLFIVCIALFVTLAFISDFKGYILLLFIFLIIVFWSRSPLITLFKAIIKYWPIFLITFIIHTLLTSRNMAQLGLYSVSGLNIDGDALHLAGFFTARLVLMVGAFAVLFIAYPVQQYGWAFGRALRIIPMSRSAISQTELVVTLALRFIPCLRMEYFHLRLACRARGNIIQSNLIGRMKLYKKLIFPLVVNAMRRAEFVSWSLQARGYNPTVERSSLFAIPIRTRDTVWTLGLFVLLLSALWM